jgi:prephenate dehydratase
MIMLPAEPPWSYLRIAEGDPPSLVGTLGPPGTSSEQAARLLCQHLSPAEMAEVLLFDTYEAAIQALRAGDVSHVVVANAYSGIHSFYMDTEIILAGAYVMDTPDYGIARVRGRSTPECPTVATHPAPVSLIEQLLPRQYNAGEIVLTSSTSAAARATHDKDTDLALTTVPAAALHDLEFISRTRRIRMLWSVFMPAS